MTEYAQRRGDLDQAECCHNTTAKDAVKLNKIKEEALDSTLQQNMFVIPPPFNWA